MGVMPFLNFDLFVYAGPNDPPNHQRNESEDGKTRVERRADVALSRTAKKLRNDKHGPRH